MDIVKMENFLKERPSLQFPDFRPLTDGESQKIRKRVCEKLGLSNRTLSLEIVTEVSKRSHVIERLNAEEDDFDLQAVLKNLGVTPGICVYVNWLRFDDIDCIKLEDLSKFFDDIWYPAADHVDIFDDSVNWIVSVDYSGTVSFLEFPLMYQV